ncbi:putative RNA-binding domain superfamily [Helianthus anomalus]
MGEASHGLRKFFVTNLLERCCSLEIGEFFSVFGEVVGVYVARKRDKKGMKGVKMGESKLLVNIAKVTVENSGYSDPISPWSETTCQAPLARSRGTTCVGDFVKDYGGSKGAGMATVEKSVVVPDRTLAFKELFGLAMIGRTVDLEPWLTSTGS